jgi:hypothetical protein
MEYMNPVKALFGVCDETLDNNLIVMPSGSRDFPPRQDRITRTLRHEPLNECAVLGNAQLFSNRWAYEAFY